MQIQKVPVLNAPEEYNGTPFLSQRNSIAFMLNVFMLNVDWFQPFKHREYRHVFGNLPQQLRYKRENIIILGIFQGPFEPIKRYQQILKSLCERIVTPLGWYINQYH